MDIDLVCELSERHGYGERVAVGHGTKYSLLPPDRVMSPGSVWIIVRRGWTVRTRYDADDEDGRDCLDYCCAMHRMTNDRHVRLYPEGEPELLPAISEFYSYS